jgi:hypothetical protein
MKTKNQYFLIECQFVLQKFSTKSVESITLVPGPIVPKMMSKTVFRNGWQLAINLIIVISK